MQLLSVVRVPLRSVCQSKVSDETVELPDNPRFIDVRTIQEIALIRTVFIRPWQVGVNNVAMRLRRRRTQEATVWDPRAWRNHSS